MSPAERAGALAATAAAQADPARAVSERAYLKSALVHLGVPVPVLRTIVARHCRTAPITHLDELLATCDVLWQSGHREPTHERRMMVVLLVCRHPRLVDATALAWLEARLRECRTWALSDDLGRHAVAGIVQRDIASGATTALDTLDRWVVDADFWIRRSAVLALQYELREGRQLERFVRYADALLGEREFFIRKVLGWVARDTGRRFPQPISDWVRANLQRMNTVTITEAVKYLPDGPELMAAYRALHQSRRRNSSG